MKKVKIKLTKLITKDLQENQIICSTCSGLGVVKHPNPFGLSEKGTYSSQKEKIKWYDNEAFTFCPDCYNGVITLCEFCGKPIPKGKIDECDCEQYRKVQDEKLKEKWKEIFEKANCVSIKDVTTMLYCEENGKYYADDDIDGFVDDWHEEIKEDRPTKLWVTTEERLAIDAENICEDACQNLHEDATDNIDYDSLQELLDDWCKKQTGTTTYFPCYKEYVKVEEWLNQKC